MPNNASKRSSDRRNHKLDQKEKDNKLGMDLIQEGGTKHVE